MPQQRFQRFDLKVVFRFDAGFTELRTQILYVHSLMKWAPGPCIITRKIIYLQRVTLHRYYTFTVGFSNDKTAVNIITKSK